MFRPFNTSQVQADNFLIIIHPIYILSDLILTLNILFLPLLSPPSKLFLLITCITRADSNRYSF